MRQKIAAYFRPTLPANDDDRNRDTELDACLHPVMLDMRRLQARGHASQTVLTALLKQAEATSAQLQELLTEVRATKEQLVTNAKAQGAVQEKAEAEFRKARESWEVAYLAVKELKTFQETSGPALVNDVTDGLEKYREGLLGDVASVVGECCRLRLFVRERR